jgi:hypothetical protein
MSVTLKPVLSALGYESQLQQRGIIQMLQASGVFGRLPEVDAVVSDMQAEVILDSVTFDNVQQAASWLHDLSQETMKRPEGQARTDTTERPEFTANRAELINALKAAGFISEAKPKLKHYDHVLLLGAKEPLAEGRMDTIRQLWEEGIRFDKIHLLGSDRPLDSTHEPIANVASDSGATLSTETEMLKAQYYSMRDKWQPDLKQVPTFAVNSYDREGHHANTKDTIETWFAAHPEPDHGNVLVISNQPFVAYQDAAVKSVLPAGFNVDTVGAPINEQDINITLAMDAFARQVDVNFAQLVEKAKTLENAQSQSTGLKASLAMFDPEKIKTDPATYQFRSNYENDTGVTEKGRYHADKWDPVLHGDPLLLHEKLDGTLYVADGHHRLDLAKHLNAEGHGPGQVAAMVLREADGYTAEDVKIIAAYKNIAHGKNDPIEAAKVFKEAYSGKVHTELLPQLQMDKGNLEVSYKLSKLSDKALDAVAKNEIPIDMAAEVASRVSDATSQESVMHIISEELHKKPAPPVAEGFAAKFASKTPASFAEREKPPVAGAYVDKVTAPQPVSATPELITR